jgi:predicted TIM-barrel fold metal-dependent hydrolase
VIVDSHAHVFQDWSSSACGLTSREEHLRYIQKTLTRPSARVLRLRDGAPASGALLFRPGDNTWGGLRDDIRFSVGPWGRLEFTVDGEAYAVQYMPVGMARIESPPEFMLAQMTYAGVDHCVLQAGFTYGYMNDYLALAQRAYPDRFTGLFHVDEPLADTPRWMAEAERAVRTLGLRGLHYQTDTFARHGFRWWFDDRRFDAFWEMIAAFDVPVFFEPAHVPDYDRASYLEIVRRVRGLMDRFPRLRWLFVLAPPVAHFARDGRWDFPPEVDAVYRRDAVWLEMCFPIAWGGVWDYPYPEAQALIRDLRDRYGAGKLVWGSDMPNVERFCTYRQCVDYVRRYCEFLSPADKDRVLGGNLRQILDIPSAPTRAQG